MATNQDLEDWLIKIAEHTRMTREALEGKGPAAQNAEKKQTTLFDRLGKRIEQGMAAAVAQRVAQAQQLANRGFQGTVEQARYDYAMEQLSKQFAAVMKPVLDGFTFAAVQIERRMRSLGGSEQNRLMGGILGAAAGLRFGGPFGALMGGMAGSLAMGEATGRYDATMGGLSGAYAGARVAGPYGAAVGAVGGAVAGGGSGDYYRMYRREAARDLGGPHFGARAAAFLAAGGATVADMVSGGAIRDHVTSTGRMTAEDRRMAPPGSPARRDVTPFQAQMVGAGETAMRIQEAMIRTTAGADFEDGGPFKPLIDLGLKILDVLLRIQNPDYRPPPATAMGDTWMGRRTGG